MNKNDGTIIVGTKVDTSGIDKGIENIAQKMDKLRKKAEQPYEIDGVKITGGWHLSEEEQKYYDRLESSLNKLNEQKLEQELLEKQTTQEITQEIKNQAEETQISEKRVADLSSEIERMVQDYKLMQNQDIMSDEDLKQSQELRQEIEKARKEYEKLTGARLKIKGITDAKKDVKEINIGIGGILKKIAKWSLAIFGVRSAYLLIRKATSQIAQYDEQLAADIQYISYAFASILEPVIKGIVQLVYQLMRYVQYLIYQWTGKNIFENANKSLKNANKNAKQLSKTLSGFDEMNILSDNTASSKPSQDLSKVMGEGEAPKWLKAIQDIGQWIIDNWEIVLVTLALTGGVLLGIKIFNWASKASKGVKGLSADFTGFFDKLGFAVEAIAVLGGFALVINSITNLIKEFSNSGLELNDVLGLMAIIVGSLIGVITTLTVASQFMQSPMAMGGLLVLTASIVAILAVLSKTLDPILTAVAKFINSTAPSFIKILETIKDVIEGIAIVLGDVFMGILKAVGDLVKVVFDTILNFVNKIGPAINRFVTNIMKAITALVNFVVESIEYVVNLVIIDGLNALINGINNLGGWLGVHIDLIPDFQMRKFNPSIPKLARGGIVYNPGSGVMMGNYIAGEGRNPEAVIPLDDRTMDRLGEAIAKHMSINNDNKIYLNARQIARQMNITNAENDFAYNS